MLTGPKKDMNKLSLFNSSIILYRSIGFSEIPASPNGCKTLLTLRKKFNLIKPYFWMFSNAFLWTHEKQISRFSSLILEPFTAMWMNTFGKTNLDKRLFSLLSEDLLFSISVAAAEIMGGREVHVEAGSTLNLTCVVRNSREKPHYLLWYHRNEVWGHKTSNEPQSKFFLRLRSTVNYVSMFH